MSRHEAFNQSGLSKFLNSPAGRIFRLVAGAGFLAVGYFYRGHALGVLSMAWGALAMSAGAFDICYISFTRATTDAQSSSRFSPRAY